VGYNTCFGQGLSHLLRSGWREEAIDALLIAALAFWNVGPGSSVIAYLWAFMVARCGLPGDAGSLMHGRTPPPGVIRRLRAKLEPDPAHPKYIITEPHLGYRLRDSL